MFRPTNLLAAAILAVAVAACGNVSAANQGGSAAGVSASPVASADANAVHVDAKDITFTTSSVPAPANRPFQLVFSSEDEAPHNVTILGSDGNPVFTGDVVTGPATTTYAVPALAPGSYHFRCDIHPNMTGTLVVQ